jgi:putative membrane protein
MSRWTTYNKTIILSGVMLKIGVRRKVKRDISPIHIILLLIVTAVFIWSVIKPERYSTWTLEVLPAVVLLIILIFTYNKFRLTTLAYFIIAILSIIMFIGGHYTYSKVPLFNWIKDYFELKRNHYDRFGHLFKGLFAIVLREILVRKTPLTKGPWLVAVTLGFSLAIGALYEIIEWLASVLGKASKATEEFLGAQGDIWDAQWDMSLTLVGSILTLLFFTNQHNKLLRKKI